MNLTERAEKARRDVLEATRGSNVQELVLTALAVTVAESWDAGYEQGYDSGLGEYVYQKALTKNMKESAK